MNCFRQCIASVAPRNCHCHIVLVERRSCYHRWSTSGLPAGSQLWEAARTRTNRLWLAPFAEATEVAHTRTTAVVELARTSLRPLAEERKTMSAGALAAFPASRSPAADNQHRVPLGQPVGLVVISASPLESVAAPHTVPFADDIAYASSLLAQTSADTPLSAAWLAVPRQPSADDTAGSAAATAGCTAG